MKTVTVMALKGGTGKSTLLLNLAAHAEGCGYPSGVVDLDPMAASVQWSHRRARRPEAVCGSAAVLPQMVAKARALAELELLWVDTPAHSEATATGAAAAADLVLIACRPSLLDLQTLGQTLQLCRGRDCAVVLTQCPARGPVVAEARAAVAPLGLDLAPRLGARVDYTRAVNAGEGVSEYAPHGKAAGEIAGLWSWLAQRLHIDSGACRKGEG